jgi:hypothetical protein
MRLPRLGATNLALMSLYFAPVWAADALHALRSSMRGFDNPAHARAASFVREVFDLGLDGLMRTSNVLAGTKLVIAVAFLAYLIEFARAVVVGREPNRETLDVVLLLAVVGILIWALPAFALDDGTLIRRSATQLLLVAGAVVVVMVERQIADAAPVEASRSTTLAREMAALRVASVPAPRQSWLPRWGAVRAASSSASH